MARLCLNLTFDEAFVSYSESWSGVCLRFEGVLREEFVRSTDLTVVKFVSGGRRFKDFVLSRDGAKVKGKIWHFPYKPTVPFYSVMKDKELVRKIKLVVDKGVPITDVAFYFSVSWDTVAKIKSMALADI